MKELLYLKDEQIKEFIEKLFLSYRDTFSDSKTILNKYSLGIAHNKVLHILSTYKGITIRELLNKLKITKVDYIISSIPLVTLPKKITNNILLTSAETLGKNKKFVQLQYSKMMDKRLKKYFNQIDIKFTHKNYRSKRQISSKKNI